MTEAATLRSGPHNAITDVPGLRVGHAHRVGDGALTGTTVVLAPRGGVVAAVDVRGGGPGTRETDALDPGNLVPRVEALVLTGGSAYGLDAVGGVVRWLEEQQRGYPVGPQPHQVVPVVPAAALFDLGRGGDFRARPDASLGYAAAQAAAQTEEATVVEGCVGAGTGALAGGVKGGIGTASVLVGDGVVVAALVAVNSAGSCLDEATGALLGSRYGLPGEFTAVVPPPDEHQQATARIAAAKQARDDLLNTTIGVVATNARLTRAEARRLATVAHDGLPRAIRPVHTLFDGDTLFAMASGDVALADGADWEEHRERADALHRIHSAAADAVTRAVAHALVSANTMTTSAGELPAYRDLYARACSGGAA